MTFHHVPRAHVTVIGVSTVAYMGVAAAQILDGERVNGEELQVIIVAKNKEALQLYHDTIALSLDMSLVKHVAVADATKLRAFPIEVEAPPPPPSPADEEDW